VHVSSRVGSGSFEGLESTSISSDSDGEVLDSSSTLRVVIDVDGIMTTRSVRGPGDVLNSGHSRSSSIGIQVTVTDSRPTVVDSAFRTVDVEIEIVGDIALVGPHQSDTNAADLVARGSSGISDLLFGIGSGGTNVTEALDGNTPLTNRVMPVVADLVVFLINPELVDNPLVPEVVLTHLSGEAFGHPRTSKGTVPGSGETTMVEDVAALRSITGHEQVAQPVTPGVVKVLLADGLLFAGDIFLVRGISVGRSSSS